MNGRRARQRRRSQPHRRRHTLNPDAFYCVQPGWFRTLDDLDEAKRSSHDMLIELMGDRRVGPVQWTWWTGQRARDALNAFAATTLTADQADYVRRIRAHLREYGGFVIFALAEGKPS